MAMHTQSPPRPRRAGTLVQCLNLAAALVLIAPPAALAAEGGMGHYLPGGTATLIDLAPTKPGWVVEPMYLHYEGNASASKAIPIAGTLAAGIEAQSDAVLLGGLYTFETPILGAHYSIGVYLPYVSLNVEAQVDTALGNVRRRDSASGVGDLLLIPAMLAWKSGFWQTSVLLPVYAPTGEFEKGRLANPGLNYWTLDPTIGASYNNDKAGFNAALYVGAAFNTENPDTDYRSGTTLHLDGSVQQLLPLGPGFLGIGAEAFYLEQVTGDSGRGARPAISWAVPPVSAPSSATSCRGARRPSSRSYAGYRNWTSRIAWRATTSGWKLVYQF